MRHGVKGKKFHRMRGQRQAFMRNLANDLIRTGRIETTEARAKAIRPLVERLVSIAKKQDLSARRLLISRTNSKLLTARLLEEIAPRYTERPGGYLRINKLMKRKKRDGSQLAVIEFV